MRHRQTGRKLNRTSSHRKSLLFFEVSTEFIPQSLTPLIINGITVVFNL